MSGARRAVAILHGGLGNQLFQLAAAMGETHSHLPTDVRLVSYGSEWGPEHPDASTLTGVAIDYPDRLMRTTLPGVAVRESWRDDLSTLVAKAWAPLTRAELIKQTDPYAGRVDPCERTRTVVLDGFFQNREWWLEAWQTVATIIDARRPEGVDAIRAEARTAVKLRRSDYLGRGIVLTDAFYREALDRLDVRDCEVVVICEDLDAIPEFTELLAERGCTPREPDPITGNRNIDDFWHLASAKRQVLANSSYSWWAAAVAEVAMRGTLVAYPTPWLPNAWSAGEMPDMGLPGWIAVPTDFV